jgi:hypothetical protein
MSNLIFIFKNFVTGSIVFSSVHVFSFLTLSCLSHFLIFLRNFIFAHVFCTYPFFCWPTFHSVRLRCSHNIKYRFCVFWRLLSRCSIEVLTCSFKACNLFSTFLCRSWVILLPRYLKCATCFVSVFYRSSCYLLSSLVFCANIIKLCPLCISCNLKTDQAHFLFLGWLPENV